MTYCNPKKSICENFTWGHHVIYVTWIYGVWGNSKFLPDPHSCSAKRNTEQVLHAVNNTLTSWTFVIVRGTLNKPYMVFTYMGVFSSKLTIWSEEWPETTSCCEVISYTCPDIEDLPDVLFKFWNFTSWIIGYSADTKSLMINSYTLEFLHIYHSIQSVLQYCEPLQYYRFKPMQFLSTHLTCWIDLKTYTDTIVSWYTSFGLFNWYISKKVVFPEVKTR